MPGRVGRRPEKAKIVKGPGAKRKASAGKTRNMQDIIERLRLERDDARELHAASAAVLKIISASRGDLKPVFEAILVSALRICDAKFGHVLLYDGERFDAVHLHDVPASYRAFWKENGPIRPAPTTALGRLKHTKRVVHIPDLKADEAYVKREPLRVVTVEQAGARSFLGVPMLKVKDLIGAIVIYRQEVRPFTETQIQLLQTFADQAVIAIENARLFNDTKEALEQQAATSDILHVISQSPTDVRPVFDAIVLTAVRLTGCDLAFFLRCDGATYSPMARATSKGLQTDARPAQPIDPDANFPSRAIVEKKTLHLPDWSLVDPPAYERWVRETFGIVSSLYLPLLCAGECIGLLVLAGMRTNIFGDREIALAESFRDQALIAIENARLFDEVQAKTRELSEALTYQTGSANILRVIASSPTDVAPVLQAIVESACELCEAYDAVVMLGDGEELCLGAHHGPIPMSRQRWSNDRTSVSGRAMADCLPVHIRDMLSDEGAEFVIGREMSRVDGCHTLLGVPLLREGEAIGAILLRRVEVHPFSDKQIALLQTFADQAVIALGNVRLFDEVRARTRDLAKSLDELRTAQDRLIQTEKLASLGQLTAGIAHEIKNPLNFVNNFSALSAELTDELNDLLKRAALSGKMQEEVNELTRLLKGNLEKVVQHGKRADSIVKNMLLHSREGSGELRPADVNALVDESLNLAYHGARAEKSGFNITLQRDFDASAGTAELFPQEITRALLNLISNGFYAATKRKTENGEANFEPTLLATTKNIGSSIEIRIRDNGTGIPPEVKEKMFLPFFTTKPTGEGTGLGLSMTHDIIVKQHSGRIDVETEAGAFTEFIITLPRDNRNTDGLKSE